MILTKVTVRNTVSMGNVENCVLKLSTNNLLALIYITAEYLALECTGGGGYWRGRPKSLLKVKQP